MILLSSIKNREFAIKDIVSDEELVLVPNASNPTDVEKANCNFKIMPKIDQSSLFESVYEHLHQGHGKIWNQTENCPNWFELLPSTYFMIVLK